MTVEELKAEAEKLGYNIIKKPENYIPCPVCGKNNRRWFWTTEGNQGIECRNCKLFVIAPKDGHRVTESYMKRLWNEMARSFKEGD